MPRDAASRVVAMTEVVCRHLVEGQMKLPAQPQAGTAPVKCMAQAADLEESSREHPLSGI